MTKALGSSWSECTILHRSILFAFVIFLIMIFLEVKLLVSHPWSGLEFKVEKGMTGLYIEKVSHPQLQGQLYSGEKIIAIKSDQLSYITLDSKTLVDDPDNFSTLKECNVSFQHNTDIYNRLAASWVTLKTSTLKEIRFKPITQRSISSLPLNFWITNLTALIGLLFAFGIWAYKQKNITSRLLISSGLFFAIASTASAIYSSRSLALEPIWYSILTSINHFAMPMVAFSLLALLLVYPHRLVSPFVIKMLFLFPIILWINTELNWIDLPLHTFYFGMILAFVCGIPPSFKQWQLSKNKPVEKAALRWMLFPIFIATGGEVFFYFAPTIFGEAPYLPLWVAQLIFLLLYIGFILGVFKYRLFDVENWWLISWHWIVSGIFIVGIDWLLVWWLQLNPFGALSIAIILMAWVYFPLRQWLWKHLKTTSDSHLENHIHDLIETFVGKVPKGGFKDRWRKLFANVFSSSSTELAGGKIDTPKITEQGMNLLVPGIAGNYHLDLYGKNQSSRLFNKQDILLVNTLEELAVHFKTLQEAREMGVKLERKRIMRDLHDDVGANLLSMIYRAKNEEDVELARDTLKLLRETIYTLNETTKMKLPLAIAKWRQEIQQRCYSAKINLRWQVDENLPRQDLNARQLVNLRRILRETLSNALKHAKPSYFSVSFNFQNDTNKNFELIILISHDGEVTPIETWHDGKGIPSIKARIKELHGKIDWTLADELQTTLSVPIER